MAKVGEKIIDLMPTEGMKAEARRYRAWKKDGRPGGTDVAATRASQILSGDELSPETVVTMAAWFARHEVDKQGKGFRPGGDDYPSPGRVAWAAWGGDSGQSWSNMKSKTIKKAQERAMEINEEIVDGRPYPNEHAARLTDPDQYDSIRRVNDEFGAGIDAIYGIKDGTSELQAIRFDADRFTPAEAREWLTDHDFDAMMFEEATGEREEERAAPDGVKVGDFVEWDSSGGTARGKVTRIAREGVIEVPDSSFTINASEEDPAALIRVYRRNNDGDYQETDTVVGHKFSELRKISALRFFEGETLKRSLSTEFRAEGEDRTLEFPFASEAPVERYYGMEVLNMDEKSMDLSRLNDGAPLLYQHDADKIVGVVQKAYIKNKRGYARVKLANNELGREMQELIKDGIIRNVSFGYKINAMEADESTSPVTYRATNFQPFEISLVTVPADASVGIGRAFNNNEGVNTASAVEHNPNGVITVDQPLNVEAIRAEAVQAKAKEVAEMIALGQRTKNIEMAQEFISNSRSLDELRSALLEKMGVEEKPLNPKDAEIGMSDKEKRDFSFIRAINALAHPNSQEAQRAAAFEMEVSRAAQQKSGKEARGILIPADVLGFGRRDLTVGSASGGGDLVATELMSDSFIDLLRKALVLQTAGATVMTGLQGMVALPRQSGGATVYHVAESGSITEGQLTVDQVTMQPRTIGALTDYSRRLLLQSSIDIENLVRRDLAQQIAIEVENQAINGIGAASYPLGFLNVTGINTESGYTTFADYVNAEAALSTDNALLGSLGYLMNSALRGTLKTTEKSATGTNANFIYEADNTINGYPAYVSNSMPNNTAVFANFSDILIGFWSGLDIMVDPYTGSASGTVRVVAMQDYDVAIRHPESICKLS
jgi:HK97 family phage major capsid protein/HK97 family phage prohead protease